MTPAFLLFACATAFVGGVAISSVFSLHVFAPFAVAAMAIFCFAIFSRLAKAVLLSAVLLGCGLGMLAHIRAVEQETLLAQRFAHLVDAAAREFSGIVVEDPYERNLRNHIVLQPENEKGRILLVSDRFFDMQFGDRATARGMLLLPATYEDFNYRAWLAAKGIYAVMYDPEIAA